MSLKRLYHSAGSLHRAFYAAFGSPSVGITWSVMSFLSSLFFLIYDEHNRPIIEPSPTRSPANSNANEQKSPHA
jgi:hypothetical protein